MVAAQAVTNRREREQQSKADEFARRAGCDPEEVSWTGIVSGLLDRWRASDDEEKRQAEIQLAYEALQQWLGAQFTAFDTEQELPEYLTAAKTSIRNGFETIIYGHTHLAKRLSPFHGADLYLNTGTWAELMCVPRGILMDQEAKAPAQLRRVLDDLAANRLKKRKGLLATFAKIEMDGDTVLERDIFVYDRSGALSRLTNGRLEPLSEAVAS